MIPRPASPGLHALIRTGTHETHRYVLPVQIKPRDGLPLTGEPVWLVLYATEDGGSLALRGIDDR